MLCLCIQVSKTKEKLYEYQEELERQHREEEDRLMAQFHQERLVEAEKMQSEFENEWERELKLLTDQFDGSQKKKDKVIIIIIIIRQFIGRCYMSIKSLQGRRTARDTRNYVV